MLASGSCDYTIRIWKWRVGVCLYVLEDHENWVRSVSWSPEGNKLASASWDRTIRLWDVAGDSCECFAVLRGHEEGVRSVSWSHDGSKLVSGGGDNSIKVWDSSDGMCLRTLREHDDQVWFVSWSPDGTKLASGSFDRTIRVWDSSSMTCLTVLHGHSGWVRCAAWSSNSQGGGTRLASASWDQTIRVWYDPSWDLDAEAAAASHGRSGGELIESHTADVRHLSWAPNGTKLTTESADKTILWDAVQGSCVAMLEGKGTEEKSVTWSPDGTKLACQSDDSTILLYLSSNGQRYAVLDAHEARIRCVAWSPSGGELASGSDDTTLRLWNASDGSCLAVLAGHTAGVRSVSWSRDGGRLASGGEDRTIRLWHASSELFPWSSDVPSEERCFGELTGHTDMVRFLSWSPDGSRLASGSGGDNNIYLWDSQRCALVRLCGGPPDRDGFVSWASDGEKFACRSTGRTIRMWDSANGMFLEELSDSDLTRDWFEHVVPVGGQRVSEEFHEGNLVPFLSNSAEVPRVSPSGEQLVQLRNNVVHLMTKRSVEELNMQ
eukprot:scaffold180_cov311-Pinguiococcus_pyrenoidosus.AAC.39